MPNALFALLNAVHPMSDALQDHLRSILVKKEVTKKSYLLKRGQVCQYIYFIQKGLLRCYYEKNQEQITSWFMKEHDIIISVKSFYTQTPGEESIIALEDTVVYGISYHQLQEIYQHFLEFNIIGRVFTTNYYILSEERLYSLRKERARDRYLFLLNKHPDIIQRVPLKYIASYLGISLETLSRIRSNI